MKDFIIVHDNETSKLVLVNLNHVHSIYFDEDEQFTAIDFSDHTFFVKESVEEIESKIRYGM